MYVGLRGFWAFELITLEGFSDDSFLMFFRTAAAMSSLAPASIGNAVTIAKTNAAHPMTAPPRTRVDEGVTAP
jgi:hypothetical protein